MKGKKPRKAQRLYSSLCFSAEHFLCHRTKFPMTQTKTAVPDRVSHRFLTASPPLGGSSYFYQFYKIPPPATFQKQNEMNFVAIFLLYVND